jgi:hypothetical protein
VLHAGENHAIMDQPNRVMVLFHLILTGQLCPANPDKNEPATWLKELDLVDWAVTMDE